jgi:hypothetical protein
VSGGGDVTAPTLDSAVIDAAGTSLVLTYSEALDPGSVPALLAFTLAGTLLAALSGTPNVTGSTVVLALSPGVIASESGITISYTAGGAPIQDVAGNDAANLVARAVTNNSTRVASPLDVSGLVWWGDMNDASTYTQAGGIVTARSNKVTAVAITPTGSPAYLATGLNSKPTVDYNGTSQYFLGTEAAVVALGVDAAAKSYLAVAALNTVDRVDTIMAWGNSGVATNRTVTFGQTNATTGSVSMVLRNDAGTVVSINGTIQTDTAAHVFAFVCPGTTAATWIDNVADIPSTAFNPGTLTPNRFALCCRPDSVPDSFPDGQQSEDLLYNRAITATERTYLCNYLKAKWGTP